MSAQERIAEIQLKAHEEKMKRESVKAEFISTCQSRLKKAGFIEGIKLFWEYDRLVPYHTTPTSFADTDHFGLVAPIIWLTRMFFKFIVFPIILLLSLIFSPLLFAGLVGLVFVFKIAAYLDKKKVVGKTTATFLVLGLLIGCEKPGINAEKRVPPDPQQRVPKTEVLVAAPKSVVGITGAVVTSLRTPDLYTFDYVCPKGHSWQGGLRKHPGYRSYWETKVQCQRCKTQFRVVLQGL